MGVIEVDELGVLYGTIRAVSSVSFAVEAGEVLALLGPNGAGKTTTVETLEGYRRPTFGRVRVLGLDPVANHAELVRMQGERKAKDKAAADAAAAAKKLVRADSEWSGDDFVKQSDALARG